MQKNDAATAVDTLHSRSLPARRAALSLAFIAVFAGVGSAQIIIAPDTLPMATVGANYGQIISATPTGSYAWSVFQGSPPPGLSLTQINAGDGGTEFVISGTPTTAGSFTFTVRAILSNFIGSGPPPTAFHQYTLTVVSTLTLTTASPLPTRSPGKFSPLPLTASGGVPPYTFSATGTLPPGMSFSGSGVLSGTPAVPGIYNFVITVTDSQKFTGSKPFQLAVGTSGQSLLLLTSSLNFTAPQGGDPASPQAVVALSASGSAVNYIALADDGAGGRLPAWLSLKPAKGTTP